MKPSRESNGHRPSPFVGAVGGNGVIHIADCGHARKDADLVAFQAVGIARAVDLLMVVQAHIHYRRRHGLIFLEDFQTQFGVSLHDLEFVMGEAARFIEYVRSNHHFADIVHQPHPLRAPDHQAGPCVCASATINAQTATECM